MKNKKKQGIPVYLDDSEPMIDDPSMQHVFQNWRAANIASVKLTRCLEAIRDLKPILISLLSLTTSPINKRKIKMLISPLYNLVISIHDLCNEFEGNFKAYKDFDLRQAKQLKVLFKRFQKIVPYKDGNLKTLRDKICAHIDKDIFQGDLRKLWETININSITGWLKEAIDVLIYTSTLNVYAWTRDSGHPHVWNLMTNKDTQVSLLLEKDKPKMIIGVTLVHSPINTIRKEIVETKYLINQMMEKDVD
jgi:hypothetical protein